MSEYPERDSFFAHEVVRLLSKTCAAQQIGPAATLLVAFVAHTEDAIRYSAPPTFYNDQWLPILGLRKWDSLDRARRAAIESGWLHYDSPPTGSRKPGTYWTLIPARYEGLDDSPIGEEASPLPSPTNGDALDEASPTNGDGGGDGRGYGRGYGRGDGGGERPSLPLNPSPSPKPPATKQLSFALIQREGEKCEKEKKEKKRTKRKERKEKPKPKPKRSKVSALYSDHFLAWWEHYPRKVAKKKAATAYQHAVKAIKQEHTCSADEAYQRLLTAVQAFQASDNGEGDRQFVPYPTTFLNQGRYDDDPSVWKRGGQTNSGQPVSRRGRTHTRDWSQIGNTGPGPDGN